MSFPFSIHATGAGVAQSLFRLGWATSRQG